MKINFSSTALLKGELPYLDFLLIGICTLVAFGLGYHPYFFGDELAAYELAIHSNYSFTAIFEGLNANKPRLVFNGIEALLAQWHSSRLMHALLLAACMTWINILLFSVVRYMLNGGRLIAWMLVLGVLTSRYGVMLYFDYLSGLVELLSTALFLSTLLLAWLAWRRDFNHGYAVVTLALAILTGFVHERYIAALLGAGFAIAVAEWLAPTARRRLFVVGWSFSLGCVPLFLYWAAIKMLGSLPITTVGAAQQVVLGIDTLWSALTYAYNVLLGGNYGYVWFWGLYNYQHPVGSTLGWATAIITIAMTLVVFLRKGYIAQNRWLGLGLAVVVIAFIGIASLAGSVRQEARFMFPVGILIMMIWIVMLKSYWRHLALAIILATNMMYFLLNSHDSMMYLYSSRAANSLAQFLLGERPIGISGIVVGNRDNSWTIGGGGQVEMDPRRGDTFSTLNLGSAMHVDPFIEGVPINQQLYDFGLVFNGFGPHRIANYRWVTVESAMIMAGVSSIDMLPVRSALGNSANWTSWQWNDEPEQAAGVIKLGPGTQGWLPVPASDLDGHWLVYRARAVEGVPTPMRLQVNWHASQDNSFLSTTIAVVNPEQIWGFYGVLLEAPAGAGVGYVYTTLNDGAMGVVELQSIELR